MKSPKINRSQPGALGVVNTRDGSMFVKSISGSASPVLFVESPVLLGQFQLRENPHVLDISSSLEKPWMGSLALDLFCDFVRKFFWHLPISEKFLQGFFGAWMGSDMFRLPSGNLT